MKSNSIETTKKYKSALEDLSLNYSTPKMIRVEDHRKRFGDLDKMNKPYSYIIIPNIIHSNEDDKANMTALIGELRTYDFKPYEDIVSSSLVHGIPEIEELDGLNELQRRLPNIGILIERLQAEIEAEKDAQLSKVDLLKKIFG